MSHFLTDFFGMLYRGALYSNLHTYDFGDAAPSVANSPGHWRRSLRHPFVRGKGGGVGLSPFEQKDDAKIAASAGEYIRIARQWRFLVQLGSSAFCSNFVEPYSLLLSHDMQIVYHIIFFFWSVLIFVIPPPKSNGILWKLSQQYLLRNSIALMSPTPPLPCSFVMTYRAIYRKGTSIRQEPEFGTSKHYGKGPMEV